MRTVRVLALSCVNALVAPWLVAAQPDAAQGPTTGDAAPVVQEMQDVPLPTRPSLTVDIACETPGPVCDLMTHPRRPILVLVTSGDPARVQTLAAVLSGTYAIVTPDLSGLTPDAARARLLEVLDHVQDLNIEPCCTIHADVAAIVFMADAADLGLSMLATGGCQVQPAHRVVLVAPRETVPTRIEMCSPYSNVGSRMPIVVDPAGDACDEADEVISDVLGAGGVLELDVAPICRVDPTAASVCACENETPGEQRFFARALVAALDPEFVQHASAGRAFLTQSTREGRLAFAEHEPSEPAHVGFAFNVTMGGGFFVRDRGAGRPSQASGPALSFRPELTFGRSDESDVGFGLYGELGSTGILGARDFYLGAGVQLVLPTREARALVPSFGVHDRFGGGGPGVTAGLYFGHRAVGGLEWPIGLRVDARIGLTDPHDHAFILSIQGELLAPIAVVFMAMGNSGSQ